MPGGVPRAARLILVELASGPLAWRRLDEVPAAVELIGSGLIEIWQLDDPVVILTPYGATLIGVHLVEHPYTQSPYWAPMDRDEPPQIERRRHSVGEPEPHPDPYRKLLPSSPDPVEAIDPVTESPMELLGVRVLIDRRLQRVRGRSPRKAP
jgi:hypothetical protein